MPFWLIHTMARGAYVLVYYIVGYRKKVVIDNLQKSFPEKSTKEIKSITKKFYQHFCATFMESVKLLTISEKEIKKRFLIKNPELIQKFYDEEKSLILYGAHFGNWEWMTSLPLHVKYQFATFYQKQSSEYFDQFTIMNRSKLGTICVESQSGFKYLITNAKKKVLTMTYVIGDQSPMSKSTKHWVQFLNRETAFLIGADKMAKKLNHGIVYPKVVQPKRGYYELEFIEINMEDEEQTPVDQFAKLLEDNIKAQPELWLWSHKRWKLKPEQHK